MPILGTDNDDGRDVLKAITILSKFSGDTAAGLQQAEHQALGQSVQGVPGPAGPGGPPPGGMPLRPPMPGAGSMGPAGAGPG